MGVLNFNLFLGRLQSFLELAPSRNLFRRSAQNPFQNNPLKA